MNKVSVIIPVYNVNKTYMCKCMSSVLLQSYKNIEVILVDDGSQKETADFCDLFVSKDNRVRVLHQPNQGVSAARNNGTINATGDYIMYVDADDVIAPFAIEDGVMVLNNMKVDMVIAGVRKITPESEIVFKRNNNINYDIYGSEILSKDLLKKYYFMIDKKDYKHMKEKGYIGRGPWARIIKTNFAKKNLFELGLPLGEDVLWNLNLVNSCDKICIINDVWYGYVIYASSSFRKFYGNRKEILEKYMKLLWDCNREFCEKDSLYFSKNMAMEFYGYLKFELLSPKCRMSKQDKNSLVRKCIQSDPWRLMIQNIERLPWKYRLMLWLCKHDLWQYLRFV